MKSCFLFIIPLFLLTGCWFSTPPANEPAPPPSVQSDPGDGVYRIDPARSSLIWTGRQLFLELRREGTVDIASGTVRFASSTLAGGELTLDMTSIKNTDIATSSDRDALEDLLKGKDFFAIDRFPEAVFKASLITRTDEGEMIPTKYAVAGGLTIKGITNDIVFPATFAFNGDEFIARGVMQIDRTEWNLRYGSGKFFPNLADRVIDDIILFRFTLIGVRN